MSGFLPLSGIPASDASPGKVNPFPCPCSYRTALLYYIDIASRPRTHVLECLIECCSDEQDKEKVRQLTASGDAGRVRTWMLPCHIAVPACLFNVTPQSFFFFFFFFCVCVCAPACVRVCACMFLRLRVI